MESSCVSSRTLLTSIVMIVLFLTMLVKPGPHPGEHALSCAISRRERAQQRALQRDELAQRKDERGAERRLRWPEKGLVVPYLLLEPKRLQGIRP